VSVFVSVFDNPDGSWTIMHDDAPGGSHTGSIQPTDVVRTVNMDGTQSQNFANVTCPVCGSVSSHPVGGGAQPPLVQEMFIHLAMADGCVEQAAGRKAKSTMTYQEAHDHVKQHCEDMDGEGRWQVTPP
jgi:hypothetical protein